MNDTKAASPKKRRGFLRVLLWLAEFLLVALVAAYFVLTSATFLKSKVLPRVSDELNAEITVSDATLHPFTSVTLKDLKVTPRGGETLLTASEFRARYSLFDILRGNLLFDEITIVSPTIHVVENADGTSNLDPILESQGDGSGGGDKEGKDSDSGPTRIDLRQLVLTNATVHYEKRYAGDHRETARISDLHLLVTGLKNGDSGKLAISANALIENNPPTPGSQGVLGAGLNGEYVFAMSADLKPLSLKGDATLKVDRAEGAFADLNAMAIHLTADVSPDRVDQLALRFQRAEEPLGQLRISGPFSLERNEGYLDVELLPVDKRVLNLAGAAAGIDFGTTTLQSTNRIELARAGSLVTVAGRLNIGKLQLLQQGQSTPALDFNADYNLTVDTAASNAVVRSLTLNGTQNGRQLLKGELSSPMSFSLGGDSAVGDSSFNLVLENLNLADWKAFLGNGISQGTVNLRMDLLARQGGKEFNLKLTSQLAGVGPVGGDKQLRSASLASDLAVQLAPNDDMILRGGMQFSNVVVIDPSGALPSTPLAAGLELDTTVGKEVIEVRQLGVALTPTSRGKNQLQLTGRLDTSETNAIQGNLKLSAESLDLTHYYDLFAGSTNQAAQTTAQAETQSSQSSGSSPSPGTAPDATPLPFKNFVAEASIGQLHLREIAASNLVALVKVDSNRIQVNPLRMSLNGAPMNAEVDLDMGVPGWKYDLAFQADRVPFAPLVNTFQPDKKGQLGGTLSANAKISGIGTSGESLQKTLAGSFDIGTTNLNLSAANVQQPMLKLLISVVALVPQLAQNPQAALTSLASGLTGTLTRGLAGGFSGDITNSPIDVISFRGSAGNGQLQLQQATVRSTIFEAEAQGTVALAPVLTNSAINIPVSIALVRPLAERLKMVSANTPANQNYVRLPDFFVERGTIGEPKAQIDAKVLAGSVLQQVEKFLPGVVGTNTPAGNIIQGIGGLLGGRPPAPAAQTNTPPPGTISAPPSATNAPAPPGTNQSPLSDILRNLGPRTRQ